MSAAPCAGARKAEQACALGGFGGFAGRLGMRKSTGMVRSSYEEEQVVLQLQAVELMKAMCKVPAPAAPRLSASLRVGTKRCGASRVAVKLRIRREEVRGIECHAKGQDSWRGRGGAV